MSLEPLGHLQYHPHPLVYFCSFTRCSPRVDLQPPGVRCFGVTGCPNLYAIFGRLFRKLHLPLNGTSCSSTVRSRSGLNNIIRRCPHIPYLAKGSQCVGMAAGSGELVIKPEGPGDVRKSFVGHCGSENAPSRFLTLEAGGGFVF